MALPLSSPRSGSVSSKRFAGLPAALLIGIVLLTSGCHPRVTDPNDPKFVVAEKGNWQITRAQLDQEVNAYLKAHQVTADQVGPAKMPILQSAMLDNMVLKKLVLERAANLQLKDLDKEEAVTLDQIKQRVPPGQDFDQQLKLAGLTMDELKERIHDEVVTQKVLEAEAFQNVDPTDQEINDFYLKYKDHFNIPPKVRASRVVILLNENTSPADKAAKKKAIDKAHARVVGGEDFSKVATEVSEDRYSAPKGGDIGYFQKGENEAQFDDVAFNTKPGTVSAVFETPMGFEFLKVTDAQPAGVVSVADARPTITNYLRQMKKSQQAEAYTKKLLAESNVTFHLPRPAMPAPPASEQTPDQHTTVDGGAAPASNGAPAPGQ